MRALWLVRGNLVRHPGGDTVQILRTAAALRRRGVQVDLSAEADPDLRGYDVVHLFHLDRLWENEAHCRRIAARGVPAVLSPIWWPSDLYDRLGRFGVQGIVARILGSDVHRNLRLLHHWAHSSLAAGARGRWFRPTLSFRRGVRFVLRTVSVLLPNSRAEQEQIECCFGRVPPSVIVPNAADGDVFHPPPRPWPEGRDGVLCVGRIEPRKNQLALIRALRGSGIALTLIGQAGRYSRRYYRQCVAAADGGVRFVGQCEPEALAGWYQTARVHACVSWYETPGLASLEAALCGCAVVVTPGGCTGEYFGGEAVYCRPESPESIRAAVESAMERGPAAALARRIAENCTWTAAAERTNEGYELSQRRATRELVSRGSDRS